MKIIPFQTPEHIIALKHDLELHAPLGKPGKVRAWHAVTQNGTGKKCVIKFGEKLNPHETDLMRAAATVDKLSFDVPAIIHEGIIREETRYCVKEFVNLPAVAEISRLPGGNEEMLQVQRAVAQGYQYVLQTYGPTLQVTPQQAMAEMGRFLLAITSWEAKLVRTNPASAKAFRQIMQDILKLYRKRGFDLMGFAHGDIHGEHVLYRLGARPSLLDFNAQVRPGKGFYDEVRALDSSIAHSFSPDRLSDVLESFIKDLETRFDPELVRPIIRARILGIATDVEKDQKNGKNMPDLDARRALVKALVEVARA